MLSSWLKRMNPGRRGAARKPVRRATTFRPRLPITNDFSATAGDEKNGALPPFERQSTVPAGMSTQSTWLP